jgi:hypothetical protein
MRHLENQPPKPFTVIEHSVLPDNVMVVSSKIYEVFKKHFKETGSELTLKDKEVENGA